VPLPGDDLDDPWGRGEGTFARVADEIEEVLRPLAAALLPAG
jgi:protein-tyrosine phosphatase